jgi:hypothetical protein
MTKDQIMELVDEYVYRQEEIGYSKDAIEPRDKARAAVVAALEGVSSVHTQESTRELQRHNDYMAGFNEGWDRAVKQPVHTAPQPVSASGLNPLWVATHPDNLQQPAEPLELTLDEVTGIAIKWSNSRFVAMSGRFLEDFARELLAAANAKRGVK